MPSIFSFIFFKFFPKLEGQMESTVVTSSCGEIHFIEVEKEMQIADL